MICRTNFGGWDISFSSSTISRRLKLCKLPHHSSNKILLEKNFKNLSFRNDFGSSAALNNCFGLSQSGCKADPTRCRRWKLWSIYWVLCPKKMNCSSTYLLYVWNTRIKVKGNDTRSEHVMKPNNNCFTLHFAGLLNILEIPLSIAGSILKATNDTTPLLIEVSKIYVLYFCSNSFLIFVLNFRTLTMYGQQHPLP